MSTRPRIPWFAAPAALASLFACVPATDPPLVGATADDVASSSSSGEASSGEASSGELDAPTRAPDGSTGAADESGEGSGGEAVGRCGDGVRDPGEGCDGADLGGQDCAAQGHDGGALACAATCELDLAGCGPARFAEYDVEVPAALHLTRLAVPGKLFVPAPAELVPRAAVMVLHGSGGLYRMPTADDLAQGRTCSATIESQFRRWGERLAGLGYVVLMPESFAPRGFCDTHDDVDRIPAEYDDPRERLLGRLYDVDAAGRYLCARPEVDCGRMGVLGFSNGASMVLLALHWQVDHSLSHFAAVHGDELDVPVLPLPAGGPSWRVGVAYYPGCGLNGLIGFGTDPDGDLEDMFFPVAPLRVEHASADPLIEDCSLAHGKGRREQQSQLVAAATATAQRYGIIVHADAAHGFDNAGPGDPAADLAARDAALAATLE